MTVDDEDDEGLDDEPVRLLDIEPWPEPVAGADLLGELDAQVRDYISLDAHERVAVVLWAVQTHAIEAAQFAPRLLLTSPVPDCGKSTLLDLLSCVCRRPDQTSGESPSTLFRSLDEMHPTLLLDESDLLIGGNRDIIRVLNAGHKRRGAVVKKTEKVDGRYYVRRFHIFAPVAVAWKGVLPPQMAALESRCIGINMQRAAPDEKLRRLVFHGERGPEVLYEIASKAARWVSDVFDVLQEAWPTIPGLSNRAEDNWRMLVAIADAAGGMWPQRARQAALALFDNTKEKSPGEMLLADIKAIFTTARMRSSEMVAQLAQMEDRPWATLTQHGLADLLRPFSIAPKQMRIGTVGGIHGYERQQFEQAFRVYVTDDELRSSSADPAEPPATAETYRAAPETATSATSATEPPPRR